MLEALARSRRRRSARRVPRALLRARRRRRRRARRAPVVGAVVKHLVLVVGVGRSGTSLLSGILGQLGFHIPQPEVKADDTNPRGFGEPRWVVDFHTRAAAAASASPSTTRGPPPGSRPALAAPKVHDELREWLRGELAEADAIVVKDPRTVWFLPLWRAAPTSSAPHLVRDDAAPPGRDRRQREQVLRHLADRRRAAPRPGST